MKNTWLIWVLIVGVVVAVLIVFNHRSAKDNVPLSELFPEEKAAQNVEYEFVPNGQASVPAAPASAPQKQAVLAPTQPAVTPAPATSNAAATTQSASVETTGTQMKKVPFTIQVGSFKDKPKAEKIVTDLNKKQFSGYMVANNLGEKGTWYRVYIGKFDTKAQAEETLAKVKTDYKESFIIAPRKESKYSATQN